MAQAMKKMGINQEEIDAVAVIIRAKDRDIIIRNPSVQKINMSGNASYQVSGEEEVRRLEDEEPQINEDDIKTVSEQAKVTKEDAKAALIEAKGDLAGAILSLQK